MKSPHDLLPIIRPLEDPNPPDELFFYENVVQPLARNIIELEAHGIPINLSKVANVEETVNDVLSKVRDSLSSNPKMLSFLSSQNDKKIHAKYEELESKKKDYTSFLKPLDIKSSAQRTAIVNYYLRNTGKEDMIMDKWTIKDLKKLNQIIASNVISSIINDTINDTIRTQYIDPALIELAQQKADIYNKNKISVKQEEISNKDLIGEFNPGSAKQKQEFFEFYGIESESETKAGAPQWSRKELERVLNLLNVLIEDKENNNGNEDS